jgi:hypothetical protein
MPSSIIRSFDYDPATQHLRIVFQTGRCYIYQEVPEEIHTRMLSSPSKGEFFNAHIREQFTFVRAAPEAASTPVR